MMRREGRGLFEPVEADLCQQAPLARQPFVHDHVKGGNPVGPHHEQGIAHIEDFTHFTLGQERIRQPVNAHHRFFGHALHSLDQFRILTRRQVRFALLMGIFSLSNVKTSPITVAIGLLSGLSYAAFIFCFRNASWHGSPQSIITIAFAVESILLLAIVGQEALAKPLNLHDSGLLLILGLFGGGPSFLLYIVGLKRSQPSLAALTGMAEPITAAIFGYLVLGQSLSAQQLIGAVLVIVTVTALNISRGGSKK